MAKDLRRLLDLKTEVELGAEELDGYRSRFDRLKNDDSAPRAVSSFNLFQTPPDIARRMVSLLNPKPTEIVLEPSAGLGRLAEAVRDYRGIGPMELIDVSPQLCAELRFIADECCNVHCGDFLTIDAPSFDCVIMNPPFKLGTDIKHILRALELLPIGGRLVSLCFDGVKQNDKLRPIADSWEVLPPDSFRSEGTRASVALLSIVKG